MRIITATTEEDISAFVHRVFAIPASSAQRVAGAVQAVIDANPHLGRRKKIPAGTPIAVPDLPDVPPRAAAGATDSAWHELETQAQQALDAAKSAWAASGNLAAQNAKASLEVLRAANFRRLAGEANVSVASITERVQKAAKDAEAQSKAELKNLDTLNAALQELIKAIGATTGTT